MKWDNVFPNVPDEFHERVIKTLETDIKPEKPNKERVKIMKIKTLTAIVAVVLSVGVITVGAYAVLGNGELFKSLFSERYNHELQQTEPVVLDEETLVLLDLCAASYTGSSESNGTVLNVLGVIGDASNIFMIMEVIAPEDIVLKETKYVTNDDSARFEAFDTDGNRVFTSSVGWIFKALKDDDPTDNRQLLSLRTEIGNSALNNADTVKIEFANLLYFDGEEGGSLTLKGKWEFEFKPDFPNTTKTKEINDFTFNVGVIESNDWSKVGEMNAVCTSIEYSPFGATVYYKVDIPDDIAERMTRQEVESESLMWKKEIKVRTADREINAAGATESSVTNGENYDNMWDMYLDCELQYLHINFETPVIPERLESIIIGDMVIPVN